MGADVGSDVGADVGAGVGSDVGDDAGTYRSFAATKIVAIEQVINATIPNIVLACIVRIYIKQYNDSYRAQNWVCREQ
jgi:hypothetical protein